MKKKTFINILAATVLEPVQSELKRLHRHMGELSDRFEAYKAEANEQLSTLDNNKANSGDIVRFVENIITQRLMHRDSADRIQNREILKKELMEELDQKFADLGYQRSLKQP